MTHGPVAPTATARSTLHPLGVADARIVGGVWAERQRVNREVSIPIGSARLREAGNLADLELAARFVADPSLAPDPDAYNGPWFMDSDVYKWLEAVAWECARVDSDELRAELDLFGKAVEAAQHDDGYVNSYVQVTRAGRDRYADLVMGHEHYCFGHLVQAAVAAHRLLGDCALWQVALRVADHLAATFGPDANPGLDGHPVVEMALVELYRESGEQRYLDLAEHFVTERGHGTIRGYQREPVYFSDRVPVRDAVVPEGHAVRAMYLAAGAADVASERGDDGLAAALTRQWNAMVESKQYVTGGLGSRWDGEAFGDPYELPPDVAYAETCASIGAVQLAWRRLLATGEVKYADAMERLLLNGFLSGVSLSGDAFFYVNALQVRSDAVPDDHRQPVNGRQHWFRVACCPPNVMRTLAQLGGYLATADDTGVQVHQYAASELTVGGRTLRVRTDYPWDGRVEVVVERTEPGEWELALRVPSWCRDATLTGPDGAAVPVAPGYASLRRSWQAGDTVVLDLPMAARLVAAHPRVDAVRGCRAIERGPLVYAVEQVDVADGTAVDDLQLPDDDARMLNPSWQPDLLGGCVTIAGPGFTAVPYCLWANREVGPMRVWLPLAGAS
ncbi:MAG TPA: beta-L-arabinofuranosidase domain-containing protein [Jatrophihabitans sp.]|jgi:hypothetical protein